MCVIHKCIHHVPQEFDFFPRKLHHSHMHPCIENVVLSEFQAPPILKRAAVFCWKYRQHKVFDCNALCCIDWDKVIVKFAALMTFYVTQYALKNNSFRPLGLRFRPVGLRFRPVGLRLRPVGLRFRPAGLCFRPQVLQSSFLGLVLDTSQRNVPSQGSNPNCLIHKPTVSPNVCISVFKMYL